MEIITVEMSRFYHSPARKSNFIQNEYVTVFKWVHSHPRHTKCVLVKHPPSSPPNTPTPPSTDCNANLKYVWKSVQSLSVFDFDLIPEVPSSIHLIRPGFEVRQEDGTPQDIHADFTSFELTRAHFKGPRRASDHFIF